MKWLLRRGCGGEGYAKELVAEKGLWRGMFLR